jgi:hypothetical protein
LSLAVIGSAAAPIEQQDGWILLWNDDRTRPRKERFAQALFRTAVFMVCKREGVDFTGEANAGRGPVDFKFSVGWSRRALVEVKPTNSSRYWHGLKEQTPQYMRSEQIPCGFCLSIGFRDKDFEEDRQEAVREAAADVSRREGTRITVIFVDARHKPSASNV